MAKRDQKINFSNTKLETLVNKVDINKSYLVVDLVQEASQIKESLLHGKK